MKKIILVLSLLFSLNLFSQEAVWDQGIPLCPDDKYISELLDKVDLARIRDESNLEEFEVEICREIGLSFYDLGLKEEAEWYLSRSKNYHTNYQWNKRRIDTIYLKEEPKLDPKNVESMASDLKFLDDLPKTFESVPKTELKNLAKQIESKLKSLIKEKDSLLKTLNPDKELIASKEGTINTLKKDKELIDLTIESNDLKVETKDLKVKTLGLEIEKSELKKYLWGLGISLLVLTLVIFVLIQRKTIKVQDEEIENQLKDISKKNTYIEHAARIIRHDMHSGINTYMPRGLSSLEKRLSEDTMKELKIDGSIKMIKEGLNHTQKVYKSVYEFTNLVKTNVAIERKTQNLTEILNTYLSNTSYKNQVEVGNLIEVEVNETLFCNAVDNLIRNGLKYNDSEEKKVNIYMEDNYLIVQDNGRGLTEKKFEKIISSKPKEGKEDGLGLNICMAILVEHGFELSCKKSDVGTKMKIKLK